MDRAHVVVVGAGPAGVRCAETLVDAGVTPVVIDEAARSGGQIYRRQPEQFNRSSAELYGSEAPRADALHRCFEQLRERIDYRPETLVWNVAGQQVYTCRGTTQQALPYDALVLCTGATDRLLPVRGWNLAGTYSLGGAQVALKSQACAIGRRVVFMGTGPLLYLVAAQYLKAGAGVAAVLDTAPASRRLAALPQLLALPDVLWKGIALTRALHSGGVPCHNGITPVAIEGSAQQGVQRLIWRDAAGHESTLECDAVAMGYHLRPETQLADLAGCEFEFDGEGHQWLVKTDAEGRSTTAGVYLAGDGARVQGARAAEVAGRLAACTVLQDLGHPQPQAEVARLQNSMARYRRFASGLRTAFPWPAHLAAQLTDDTIVCRCESIHVGELRNAVQRTGAFEANRAKSFSRIGMGRCQGRYCGNAAAEVIAQAAAVTLEQAGRLRGQAPVKPLPLSLAARSRAVH